MKYAKYVLLLLTVLSPLIGERLSPIWVWENGILEWAQVGILLLGALVALAWAVRARRIGETPAAWLWVILCVFMLLFVGRELNWGRAFMVIGHNANGPILLPNAEYRLAPVLNVITISLILGGIVLFIAKRLYRVPLALIRQRRFPVGELLVAAVAAAFAQLTEELLHNMYYEETGEVCLYLAFILVFLMMRPTREQPHTLPDLPEEAPEPVFAGRE